MVVDRIRETCEIVIKGNCDDIVVNNCTIPTQFWTREKLGAERLEYLASLPNSFEFYISGYLVRLFHASPFNLDNIYNPMYKNVGRYKDYEIIDPDLMFENTPFLGKTSNDKVPDIIGYGHIHTPNLFRHKNKTLFNPGTVGIPMELSNTDKQDESIKFSTLSSYMILEGEYNSKELNSLSFNLIRLPYDVQEEINSLSLSDMPDKEAIINKLKTATY